MREEETVVMMRLFPTIERKNHLYKEDVGVYAAKDEGGGDSGDDEDVPPTMERKNHLYKEGVGVSLFIHCSNNMIEQSVC